MYSVYFIRVLLSVCIFYQISSTRSFVGLDPWGLDPGAWKKPKLSKSEVNLKKVEKIHEKSKPVCEQSNR